MNSILSPPRYISEITYSKDAPAQERFVFEAVIGSSYELIAAGHGSLRFGQVMFHRVPRSQVLNGQFSYLAPQTDLERNDAGTYSCDMAIEEQIFDRWMTSGILDQQLSLTISFGFMPPAGLQYGAGPNGWECQTWFVETHRDLLVTEFSLIVPPAMLRCTSDAEDFARGR